MEHQQQVLQVIQLFQPQAYKSITLWLQAEALGAQLAEEVVEEDLELLMEHRDAIHLPKLYLQLLLQFNILCKSVVVAQEYDKHKQQMVSILYLQQLHLLVEVQEQAIKQVQKMDLMVVLAAAQEAIRLVQQLEQAQQIKVLMELFLFMVVEAGLVRQVQLLDQVLVVLLEEMELLQ